MTLFALWLCPVAKSMRLWKGQQLLKCLWFVMKCKAHFQDFFPPSGPFSFSSNQESISEPHLCCPLNASLQGLTLHLSKTWLCPLLSRHILLETQYVLHSHIPPDNYPCTVTVSSDCYINGHLGLLYVDTMYKAFVSAHRAAGSCSICLLCFRYWQKVTVPHSGKKFFHCGAY